MDYELLGQSKTGLDLIEFHQLQNRAILVTSRYDEKPILERCNKIGVKLIPKGMAPLVPIQIQPPKQKVDLCHVDDDDLVNRPKITQQASTEVLSEKIKYDLCLLDDDRTLIHWTWRTVAESKGLTIKMFSTPEEFFEAAKTINLLTPIYVDISLGNGVNGIKVAEEIHNLGFVEINLATGYEPDSINAPSFIHKIVGKDFPDLKLQI